MSKKSIGNALRQYRKANDYSISDVVTFLSSKGYSVADKTIYGWENGTTQPSADLLMVLCELYNISDILHAFGYSRDSSHDTCFELTDFEKELVRHYRNCEAMQPAVNKLLNL